MNERKMEKKSLKMVFGKGGSLIVSSINIFEKLMIIFYLTIASKFYYKLTEMYFQTKAENDFSTKPKYGNTKYIG